MKKPRILLLAALSIACISAFYLKEINNFSKKEKGLFHSEVDNDYNEDEEREAGIEKEMMAWFQSRGYPNPYFLNAKYQQAWEQFKKLREQANYSATRTQSTSNWTSLGPSTGIGGRILSIAVNPVKNTSIYIGSASGGIWKSYNGGNNWQPVTTDFPVLGVSSVIINPSDTMVIYAGTGEVYRMDSTGAAPNPGNTGYNVWKTRGTYGVGILKSTNGGNTWTQVLNKSMANLFAIQRLRFDPTNPNIVYACATDGLYRTTDAGTTWNKILNLSFVWDVVVNAKNTNQIVATVGNLQNTVKGIWRSTNGGTTWSPVSSGLPASFRGYIRLDNVPTLGNRDTIVASIGVDENGSPNELYRSTDFGSTWSALASSTHCSYQFWCAHDVAINPSNTNKLIYAGVNVFSYTLPSTSGSISGIHSDIHDIVFDPSNSNNVYIACDGGMYKSTNGGTTFSQIDNGLAATQFYASIGVSATDPNLIIGGLQDNQVYMTTNGGVTWSQAPSIGGDGAACVINPKNDNKIIASIDARGFYRSTNRGGAFSSVMSYLGGPHDSRTAFVAPVAMSKKNPAIVYVGTDNLHKSTDTGGTWSNNVAYSGNTTPANWIEAVHKTAIAMAIPPSDPTGDTLYVSTSPFAQFDNDADGLFVTGQPNILKTTNGATPFTSVKGTLPDRFVMDIAISPTNRDSVYIALGGFGTSHIYVSPNGGTTWNALGAALPDVPFNSIVFDPVNPQIIYAACDLGVYVSGDRGVTWYDFNAGFWDATQVVDLQITANNKILAATHGKGIFISDLYTLSSLPVTLIDFGGSRRNNVNELHWTVTQEQNFSRYELEESSDGVHFQKITTVASQNRMIQTTYTYNDLSVNSSSENYYRLKMINLDGSFSYSAVILIKVVIKNKFSVIGIPFHDFVILQYNLMKDETLNIALFNTSGAALRRENYKATQGTGAYMLSNLTSLAKGMYVLRIDTNDGSQSIKIEKN